MIQACAQTQCSVNEHRPDPARPWSTDHACWQAFVDADAADREQQVIDEVLSGLECSRLARNNADWHALLRLCAFNNTLICEKTGCMTPPRSTTGCCSASKAP
jgi:hypothetical protein